jgi:hypothetical protein
MGHEPAASVNRALAPAAPPSCSASCSVCEKPINEGERRYREPSGDVHVSCYEVGVELEGAASRGRLIPFGRWPGAVRAAT